MDNAVGHRDAAYSMTVLTAGEGEDTAAMREVRDTAASLFARQKVGRSLNFSFGPLGEDEVREAFSPEDLPRPTRSPARHRPARWPFRLFPL